LLTSLKKRGNKPSDGLPSKIIVMIGCFCIFMSAVFFYLATAVIRWATAEVEIDASFYAFTRFLLGFVVICVIFGFQRRSPASRRYDLLIGRTIFNCIAVFCFYRAVEVTSLAEGNILNMTYPIFLAVLSWFILKEQRDLISIVMVVTAFVGIWLILAPAELTPELKNLWGLVSGITASFAILYLNISRKYHDTATILFYMFGLGSVIMYILFYDRIFIPNIKECRYLLICSLFGISGQYLLTLGFRYVTAVEGAIISSSRILMAAVLGPWIALDPPLSISGWIGAMMILCANVVIALRKAK